MLSESIVIKMPHCLKSHATAQILLFALKSLYPEFYDLFQL